MFSFLKQVFVPTWLLNLFSSQSPDTQICTIKSSSNVLSKKRNAKRKNKKIMSDDDSDYFLPQEVMRVNEDLISKGLFATINYPGENLDNFPTKLVNQEHTTKNEDCGSTLETVVTVQHDNRISTSEEIIKDTKVQTKEDKSTCTDLSMTSTSDRAENCIECAIRSNNIYDDFFFKNRNELYVPLFKDTDKTMDSNLYKFSETDFNELGRKPSLCCLPYQPYEETLSKQSIDSYPTNGEKNVLLTTSHIPRSSSELDITNRYSQNGLKGYPRLRNMRSMSLERVPKQKTYRSKNYSSSNVNKNSYIKRQIPVLSSNYLSQQSEINLSRRSSSFKSRSNFKKYSNCRDDSEILKETRENFLTKRIFEDFSFKYFSKRKNRLLLGKTISSASHIHWLTLAGIIKNKDSEILADLAFKEIAGTKTVLTVNEYEEVLRELAKHICIDFYALLKNMNSCAVEN